MTKPAQALILDPPTELHFQAPFTEVVTSYLKLTNPTNQNICFKIKTTAPKTYCVKPNYGVIHPKETITVSLMLQPLDFEATEKSKHKFMVQSIFAPEGEEDLETPWSETPAERFMNSKLVCIFDPPPVEAVIDGHGDASKTSNEIEQEVEKGVYIATKQSTGPDVQKLEQAQERRRQLQEHVAQLKQENLKLKEESSRTSVSKVQSQRASEESSAYTDSPYPQPKPAQKPVKSSKTSFSVTTYLFFLLVLLLGIYLGYLLK